MTMGIVWIRNNIDKEKRCGNSHEGFCQMLTDEPETLEAWECINLYANGLEPLIPVIKKAIHAMSALKVLHPVLDPTDAEYEEDPGLFYCHYDAIRVGYANGLAFHQTKVPPFPLEKLLELWDEFPERSQHHLLLNIEFM